MSYSLKFNPKIFAQAGLFSSLLPLFAPRPAIPTFRPALTGVFALNLLWFSFVPTAHAVSTEERLIQYGKVVEDRLAPFFTRAHVTYPPQETRLLFIKSEKRLEIYARDNNAPFRFIRSYPILAASGDLGPKVREGDFQVPEGIYQIDSLNPNSRFHLALHVNYPNAFDRQMAKKENRHKLGGDIMIHGNAVSIGCLAMGDSAAEDLFVLAAETGLPNVKALITPLDFRKHEVDEVEGKRPVWSAELYQALRQEMKGLKK